MERRAHVRGVRPRADGPHHRPERHEHQEAHPRVRGEDGDGQRAAAGHRARRGRANGASRRAARERGGGDVGGLEQAALRRYKRRPGRRYRREGRRPRPPRGRRARGRGERSVRGGGRPRRGRRPWRRRRARRRRPVRIRRPRREVGRGGRRLRARERGDRAGRRRRRRPRWRKDGENCAGHERETREEELVAEQRRVRGVAAGRARGPGEGFRASVAGVGAAPGDEARAREDKEIPREGEEDAGKGARRARRGRRRRRPRASRLQSREPGPKDAAPWTRTRPTTSSRSRTKAT